MSRLALKLGEEIAENPMPRDRDVQRTSRKRERWRFLQSVRAITPEQVQKALCPDSDVIGCFLRIFDGRAIIEGVTLSNERVIFRFSDMALETACGEYLESVGRVVHNEAEAEEYCRRVLSEALHASALDEVTQPALESDIHRKGE